MRTQKIYFPVIVVPAMVTTLILLIPFTAMYFTPEVNWTLTDFIAAGTLLFGTGLIFKLITKSSEGIIYKIAVGFALLTGLFLIWSNLAVGIIGSENNAINLLYFGVIAVGIIGSIIAGFRAKAMAVTLWAMAVAHALITATALYTGMDQLPGSSVFEILGVNGLFIKLFLAGGFLFRYADKKISEM